LRIGEYNGRESPQSRLSKREIGYLYFIDKQGDISRSVMARGSKASKKKTAAKKIKKTTKGR